MIETEIGKIENPVDRYFTFCRERHNIYLKKFRREPRPWTTDPILNHYKFTNVFRNLDKTTAWYHENVMQPWCKKPEVLLTTVMYRWCSRIEIGQIMFDPSMPQLDLLIDDGDFESMEATLRHFYPKGPWVTGGYLITTPKGYDKLGGIIKNMEVFYNGEFQHVHDFVGWSRLAETMLEFPGEFGLEDTWRWLSKVPFLGTFHSNEIVQDLRYTALLDKAKDIDTWTNIGPGAQRGINRIKGRDIDCKTPQKQTLQELIDLLELSRDGNNWPTLWPKWELHQVQFSLCEMDKYERTRLGQGRPRSTYK